MESRQQPASVVVRSSRDDPEWRLRQALGAPYIEYRTLWSEVAHGKVALDYPLHLDIELQDFCNQSCIMCPRNEEENPQDLFRINTKTQMGAVDVRSIISEAAEMGTKSINFGAFAEPLICRDLWDHIAYAHSEGFVDSRVITNGLLLHRYTDKVFSSGLRNLFVSIDAASPETYARIRGRGYERITEAVHELVSARAARQSLLPVIRVSFVEMQENRHEKADFLAYWADVVDIVDVQAETNYGSLPEGPLSDEVTGPKVWNCRSPWQRLAVTAVGEILPCCDFNGKNIPIGDWPKQGLRDAWTSQRMARVREGLEMDSLLNCSRCQRSLMGAAASLD